MNFGLQGKKAVVMGGSSGLGKAIARNLIEEGAQVAIVARTKSTLEEARQEINATTALSYDFSKVGFGSKMIKDSYKQLGGLDIVVINSGGPKKGFFSQLSVEDWREGFQLLFMSAIETMQAALPILRDNKWGRIIIISSVAAKETVSELAISSSLRAGLHNLINVVSREEADKNITINAILPGFTDTDRMKALGLIKSDIIAQIPAKRLGKPEEIGALASFLASEQAAFITGQALACDGGWLKSI